MKHPLLCSAPTQSLWLTPCCFIVSGLLSFVGTGSYLWVVAGVIGKNAWICQNGLDHNRAVMPQGGCHSFFIVME